MKSNETLLKSYKELLDGRAHDYAYDLEGTAESIETLIENIKNDECELFSIDTPNELSTYVISEFIENAAKAKAKLTENCYATRKCTIQLRWHEAEYCDCTNKCENCILALLEELGMNSSFC